MSAPLRVLHAHAGNLYGGVETILVTLARLAALEPRLEHRFALCFEGRLSEELRSAGAQVDSLGPVRLSRPWTVRRDRLALDALLARDKPDVVLTHSTWSHAIFAPIAAAHGLPCVYWQHAGDIGPVWLAAWARAVPPAHVICTSAFAAHRTSQLFAGVPRSVLHPPVAPAPANQRPGWRDGLRAVLGVRTDTVVILHAGRFEPWKGQLNLVRALADLGSTRDWVCWLVGAAQRKSEVAFERHVRDEIATRGLEPRVRMLGQRSDVRDLMAAADVFCQPNTEPEPFGIVFVEALYASLPTVASASGGALEILDASCGLTVPPGETFDLARALRLLIEDRGLRTRLGDGGPLRARALCDPAQQVRELHDLLAQVETGHRAGRFAK